MGGEREESGKGQGGAVCPTCVCVRVRACALYFIFSWLSDSSSSARDPTRAEETPSWVPTEVWTHVSLVK